MKPISRRAMLRGAGVSVTLPLLEAMAPRRARAATGLGIGPNGFPRRLILMHTGSGFVTSVWPPPGATASNFAVGPVLEALAPVSKDVLLLTGVDNVVHKKTMLGVDHPKGMGTLWTARELLPGTMKNGPDDVATFGWPNGRSVDQEIAAQVGVGLPFKSLELGILAGSSGGSLFNRNIFGGPNQPLPPESSPARLFDRVFKNLNANPLELQQLRDQRKSILDRVMPRYQALSARLGAADRDKVELHLASIREVETRLGGKAGVEGTSCAKPTLGAVLDHNANDNTPTIARLQIDQLVMAMACDLTRVGSLEFNGATSGLRYTWEGITDGHHDLSHKGDSDVDARAKLLKIDRWNVQQFVYLVQKLAAVKEGAGTLLDNSIVVWTSELAKGNSHAPYDKPYLIAGRGGGAIRPGRWMAVSGEVPHGNLLVTLMNAMGLPATTFGHPDHCTGALAGLD
jgi:hypothetical protein